MQVIMLRSLTSYVRLLPGYRMYRACKVLLHAEVQRSCPNDVAKTLFAHVMTERQTILLRLQDAAHNTLRLLIGLRCLSSCYPMHLLAAATIVICHCCGCHGCDCSVVLKLRLLMLSCIAEKQQ